MPKLSSLTLFGPKRILMKGKSRSGKTQAAGSYPKPLLEICLDGRWATLLKEFPEYADQITVEPFGVDEFVRFDELATRLETTCPYKTIIIDTLTDYASMALQYAIRLKRGEGGTKKGKQFGVLELNSIEDYGVENAAISALLAWVKLMQDRHKITVILTAHLSQLEVKPLDKPSYTVRELMTGGKKAAVRIPGLFDEIYHFETVNNDGVDLNAPVGYRCYTKRGGEDFADTVYPVPAMIEWTNKRFYDVMNSFPGMIEARKEENEARNKVEENVTQGKQDLGFGGI